MQQNKYCDIQEHCKLLCEANEKYNKALQYIGKMELEKRIVDDAAFTYELSEKEYKQYKKMQQAISEIEKINVIKQDGALVQVYYDACERAYKYIKQIINNLNSENIEIKETVSDDFGLYGYGANIDNSPRTATEIIRGNKLAEIKKICTENLKYRNTMGGYVPTRPTRVLEKIIEIIDKEN